MTDSNEPKETPEVGEDLLQIVCKDGIGSNAVITYKGQDVSFVESIRNIGVLDCGNLLTATIVAYVGIDLGVRKDAIDIDKIFIDSEGVFKEGEAQYLYTSLVPGKFEVYTRDRTPCFEEMHEVILRTLRVVKITNHQAPKQLVVDTIIQDEVVCHWEDLANKTDEPNGPEKVKEGGEVIEHTDDPE